ncbi:MAG: hypothetical protein IT384_04060 [Deltaproteobacteria bacterium]|nr:hypothetical protein [Deltaproteobacteria bacterium]
MRTLKLDAMAAAWAEQSKDASMGKLSFDERLALQERLRGSFLPEPALARARHDREPAVQRDRLHCRCGRAARPRRAVHDLEPTVVVSFERDPTLEDAAPLEALEPGP